MHIVAISSSFCVNWNLESFCNVELGIETLKCRSLWDFTRSKHPKKLERFVIVKTGQLFRARVGLNWTIPGNFPVAQRRHNCFLEDTNYLVSEGLVLLGEFVEAFATFGKFYDFIALSAGANTEEVRSSVAHVLADELVDLIYRTICSDSSIADHKQRSRVPWLLFEYIPQWLQLVVSAHVCFEILDLRYRVFDVFFRVLNRLWPHWGHFWRTVADYVE